MAETNGENKIPGVYGGIYNGNNTNYEGKNNGVIGGNVNTQENNVTATNNAYSSFSTIGVTNNRNVPVKAGFWSKVKSFLFQEIDLTAPIKVELTPYQQKVEDEINEFLHQEITFSSIKKLFNK